MFPILFLLSYLLDLFTTILTFLRGATEANPLGWPVVLVHGSAALATGLLGYLALMRINRNSTKARLATAVAWSLLEAAGAARFLVVVNNVLVLVVGFGFADAVGFHGVLAGTAVLTAVLVPLFFLLTKVRILHARTHVSTAGN